VWLPGKVAPEQAAFYVDLMKKVQATPEWKDYIEKTSQVDTFLTGDTFDAFIKQDLEHLKLVASEQGWLVAK
jgi:putative tricarboxylic transport membrane protein